MAGAYDRLMEGRPTDADREWLSWLYGEYLNRIAPIAPEQEGEEMCQHGRPLHQDCFICDEASASQAASGGGELPRNIDELRQSLLPANASLEDLHDPLFQSRLDAVFDEARQNLAARRPSPAPASEVDGIWGECICEQNAEDYMRPCPVHAPSESERELAAECLAWAAGEMAHEPHTKELLSKAAAVIDRQVSRQNSLAADLDGMRRERDKWRDDAKKYADLYMDRCEKWSEAQQQISTLTKRVEELEAGLRQIADRDVIFDGYTDLCEVRELARSLTDKGRK